MFFHYQYTYQMLYFYTFILFPFISFCFILLSFCFISIFMYFHFLCFWFSRNYFFTVIFKIYHFKMCSGNWPGLSSSLQQLIVAKSKVIIISAKINDQNKSKNNKSCTKVVVGRGSIKGCLYSHKKRSVHLIRST